MKQLLIVIISMLVLVCGSAGISNAAPQSEDNRLIAGVTIYKHVKAMKWQRGKDVGTVTIKIDPKKGEVFYNGRKFLVTENIHYSPWDDSSTDPRCKYQWKSFIHSNTERSFDLYYNY